MKILFAILSVLALSSFGCNRGQEQQDPSREQNFPNRPNARERFEMGAGSSKALEANEESSKQSD